MIIYKYHIAAWQLYQKHSSAFCSSEAYDTIHPQMLSYLHSRKIIKWINRSEAELLRPAIKYWRSGSWVFHTFTTDGLKIVRLLDENPGLMAKKLLNDLSKKRF